MVLSPVQSSDAPVETVLARLKGVRKSLHGWVACCPAHQRPGTQSQYRPG